MAQGHRGVLRGIAYWRNWDQIDRDMGGGWAGTAVLDCGHTARLRATKANRWLRSSDGSSSDELGRPLRTHCLECRVAREAA